MVYCVCLPLECCLEDATDSVYVGGYGGLSENELCVFAKLYGVGSLGVCECSSILLQSVIMSCVDSADDG